MIEVGKYNELTIARQTENGLYLKDEENQEVLLPNKYKPETFEVGDRLNVFVYRDSERRKVATTLTPKIKLNEFAFLEVVDLAEIGAFLDWGLEKHLFVPFNEEGSTMQIGHWHVVYMDKDDETDNIYATNKVREKLDNEFLMIKEGDEVDLIVYNETGLGYSVAVNNKYDGLIFKNEVFTRIKIGDKLKGYIKKIGEGNKLDISLQAVGYRNFNDKNCELIYNALQKKDGVIGLSDKSTPGDIYAEFGISKKAFKKAIGALYQERKISIGKEEIKLV